MVGNDCTRKLNEGDTHNTTFSLIFETLFIMVCNKKSVHTRVNKYKEVVVILCFCVRLERYMNEKYIERKLAEAVKKTGGLALKFVSPGLSGVPDRLVLMPKGRACFVELKSPGQKMRPLQLKRKVMLESLGFQVYCIDSIEKIGGVIDEIRRA